MRLLILGLFIAATFSLTCAYRSEKTKKVNFTCLTDTRYDMLSSKDVTSLIQKNQTLYDVFIQTLIDLSTPNFNLTVHIIKSTNGAKSVDFKSLYNVPGVLKALDPFYRRFIIPIIFKKPAKECVYQIEALFDYLMRGNRTLRNSLIDFIKQNVAKERQFEYLKPKGSIILIDLKEFIEEQSILMYKFVMSKSINATIEIIQKKPIGPAAMKIGRLLID